MTETPLTVYFVNGEYVQMRGSDAAFVQMNRAQPVGKRPKFPSGATEGMRTTMSSWPMKRERELGSAFAGFDRYQRSGGLRS